MKLRRVRAVVARWMKPHAERVVFGHARQGKSATIRTVNGRSVADIVKRTLLLGVAVLVLSSCTTIGTAISCTVAHGCVTR